MEISKVIIDDVYPPPRAIHTASFWTSKCRTTANCRDGGGGAHIVKPRHNCVITIIIIIILYYHYYCHYYILYFFYLTGDTRSCTMIALYARTLYYFLRFLNI